MNGRSSPPDPGAEALAGGRQPIGDGLLFPSWEGPLRLPRPGIPPPPDLLSPPPFAASAALFKGTLQI